MRRFAPALVAVALVTALAGCSAEGGSINADKNNAVCGPYTSGKSSDAVTATGSGAPKVSFPTPLTVDSPQVTLISAGTGAQIGAGDAAQVGASYWYGTGKTGGEIGYVKSEPYVLGAGESTALDRSLQCRRVGDRYVVIGRIDRLLGKGFAASRSISKKTTVLVVVDVKKRLLGKADGVNQLQDNALPAVVTAVDGQPGLVAPNTAPPKRVEWATVKAGGGAEIRRGDAVVVKFSSFSWTGTGTGSIAVDNADTWTKDSPGAVRAGTSTSNSPFAKTLIGVRVGSQLIYSVPSSGGAEVYVIDVLGTV